MSGGGHWAQTAFFLGAVRRASVDISPLRYGACDPCSCYMDLEGGFGPPGGQQLHLAGCGVRGGLIPPFGEAVLVKQQRGHSYGHRGHLCEGRSGMQKRSWDPLSRTDLELGISPSECSLQRTSCPLPGGGS